MNLRQAEEDNRLLILILVASFIIISMIIIIGSTACILLCFEESIEEKEEEIQEALSKLTEVMLNILFTAAGHSVTNKLFTNYLEKEEREADQPEDSVGL